MSPEIQQQQQVRRIFDQAREQPEETRDAFVGALCAGKPEIEVEVRRLLAADRGAKQSFPSRMSAFGEQEAPARIGRYQVVNRIGGGGMGWVYKAWDPTMGRFIAVKTIRIDGNNGFLANRESLLSEMKLGGKLGGIQGIVNFHDAGVDDAGGVAYIAMELVEGPSLERIIAPSLPLEAHIALGILREAAAALDMAHSRGVVHCDVKPANILLQDGRTVKITDFGISRVREPGPTRETAAVLGTPGYMSPEQISQSKQLDGRSDQYSLAVVGFQLLTGKVPFELASGNHESLLYAILGGERPSARWVNPSLPLGADEPLKRGMAIDPAQRFSTCAEFVDALTRPFQLTPWLPQASREPETIPTHPDNLRKMGAFAGPPQYAHQGAPPIVVKKTSPYVYVVPFLAVVALAGGGVIYKMTQTPGTSGGPPLRTPAPLVARFTAEPAQVKAGDAALLSWDVKYADYIIIDQGIGKVRPSGSIQVRPDVRTSYTLNATGKGGDNSARVSLGVFTTAPGASPALATGGVATGPHFLPGDTRSTTPAAAPVVTRFEAEPGRIKPGESATLHWETSGAQTVVIDQRVGKVLPPSTGSIQVSPAVSTQYTLTASGKGGEITATSSIAVASASPKKPPSGQLSSSDVETLLKDGKKQLNDHEETSARESFRKAAEGGNTESMVLLGAMCSQGLGGAKNDAEAVRMFRQAADAGNVRGMYNLGHMYANGQGVTKSQTEAANWYARAVNGGSSDAAYRLAMMYELGVGVPQDLNEAKELYQKAGTPEAKSQLARLAQRHP